MPSKLPMEPPVSSAVAMRVISPVPWIARPWPGPMIMPLEVPQEVASCASCPADSFIGFRLLFPEPC